MTTECKQVPQNARCVILFDPERFEHRVNVWFDLNGHKYGAFKRLGHKARTYPQETMNEVVEWVHGEAVRLNAEPMPLQNAVYDALKDYLVIGWVRKEARPHEQRDSLDAETKAALEELYAADLYCDVVHGEEIRREAKDQFRKLRK